MWVVKIEFFYEGNNIFNESDFSNYKEWKETYNLDIDAGWNRLYVLDNRREPSEELIFSTNQEILTSIPKNFRWIIFGSNEYP